MNETMKLQDTMSMMVSDDYKERFKAEYYQLKIRLNGLQHMLINWDNETLKFQPTCPRSIYDLQLRSMTDYLTVLEARAAIEGIEL